MGDGRAREGAVTTVPDDSVAGLVTIARAGEPDRYLAALLAPEPQRQALLALAAFAAELARVPHRAVREPFMGEIRLEWWRTALGIGNARSDSGGESHGEGGGHVVAEAMRTAMRSYNLSAVLIDDMIEARALELRPAPFQDRAALNDFLDKTEGILFALACRVIGLGPAPEVEAACAAAGRAYGLARLMLRLPRTLGLGRVPLAQTEIAAAGLSSHELLAGTDVGAAGQALLQVHTAQIRGSLAEARRLVHGLRRRKRVAFLPLALVRPYLRVLERQGCGALREEARIVPLTRVWAVAAAHIFGRL